MHVSLQLALVAAVVVLAACEPGAGSPGSRAARAKQPRATRGFKNSEMMTARGFGKRNYNAPRGETVRRGRAPRVFRNPEVGVARGFGKRSAESGQDEEVFGLDAFWDALEGSQQGRPQEQTDDKAPDSIPVDWFVEEMLNNPDFARTVVRKFVDTDQDGALSLDELLRNAY